MTTPMSLHPDHNKFSSLSHTTVVAIFLNVCLWRRSLCSNWGSIDPEKLYRATLIHHLIFVQRGINARLCKPIPPAVDRNRKAACYRMRGKS